MAALTDLTLANLAKAMAQKEASAVEVAEAHLKKLDEHRALNAFITETPEKARAMAQASDERRARGQGGLLEGVPLAIKDLFCTEGVQTTAASHILEGFVPPYESTVTAILWKAGAVMVGKTNLDEFAMGSSNMTSHFGGVENPWKRKGDNRKLVPGGSSGGSAAAVGGDTGPGSTGTDAGAAIRQPARALASWAIRNRASPTGKMGTGWDTANAALFLASDESAYVNGHLLVVDGEIGRAHV